MAQPSREGTFAATALLALKAMELSHEILPAAGHNKRRPICDGNFAPTELQISYI